jgi:general secretion pathway protein G
MNSAGIRSVEPGRSTEVSRKQRGFTLIELLIVVAIIGILAVIAVPNLMNALDKTRQKATMANMKRVGEAVAAYSVDNNVFPEASGTVDPNLDVHIEPYYITRCPDEDEWGHPLFYDSNTSTFTLRSYGKDGKSEPIINGGKGGETSNFSADIVMVDGNWIQAPTGRQE